ncbi:acetyl-CoA carboxylase 1 isoform X1 [Selaginella moellendorffii]|uniref:acetyl-CoA carboxylase 1 isoform X1 n=1 Tax=Selaginella moellendorffii TaxID=88036 RepID=UPI000D1C6E09|nr:acetyl-CoA carboxylase 1 isoform X1 [Selaginella moellendorffii]|eukprot:XP_024517260.1 acetyl-CoA carboxylase 1 isoform X1 [Selaginella moellendorffii]
MEANGHPHSQVDDYCFSLGGARPIHSILIANNGMAAVKFMRSVRSWAYEAFGAERAVVLVAMATPEDMRINAEHIRMADQFVEVPGGTNNNNYANVQLITEVAERAGVAAVWPGWGHASENPDLPSSLAARNIVFLGPPAAPMAALGDKIGSSLIAQAAGVPTLPWSGSNVAVPFESCRDGIPEELYKQACVFSAEEALAMCQKIGYPAMIKASWGGGGKGIRKVHNDEEVKALFKQVQGEVPGSPIFIMKVASQCRHLEVQLLCDQYGNVAALHSRDCSVQRRHQKIIEEGPITIAPPETVRLLEQGARRLAQCVSYVGAATVEYLYSMETGEFHFLELNPRLQVEHPVTEWIAEVNLPAAQLAVGMGIPLWKIPEIRRFYGKEDQLVHNQTNWHAAAADTAVAFDFDTAVANKPRGHVVAVRVTSEDPDDGFKPTTGKVQEVSFRSKPNIWAYFSVKSGGGIHEFSDSQFGHVFAFGETRPAAIANMVLGLKELHIRGEIHTNVDYTVDLLHAPEYKNNKIHTGWLDGRIAMRLRAERPLWYLSVVCGAIYRTSRLCAARVSEYIGYLEKGQIPPKNISLVNFRTSLNIDGSKYTMELTKGGPGTYRLNMNNSRVEAEVHTLRDGGLLVQVCALLPLLVIAHWIIHQLDGNSHVVYGEEEAAGTRLLIDGRTCLLQNDHDPSRLIAETPCKLMRFLVADGSHVDTDTPYAEVEVMKMCMPLLSPASGTIHFKHLEAQAMVAGDLIAVLDLDDPSAVRKAVPFSEGFPALGTPIPVPGKVHHRCALIINASNMILAGYEHNVDEVVQTLLSCLDDPQLPVLQWQECIAVLASRIPTNLKARLDLKLKEYEASSGSERGAADFPAKGVREVLEEFLASATDQDRATQERLVEPLLTLAKSYEGGRRGHACSIVKALFEEYLLVEEHFSQGTGTQADVIESLRHVHKKDLWKVVDIVLSHQGIKTKNALMLRLIEALVYPNPSAYRDQLVRLAALSDSNYTELAVKSSLLLEQSKLSGIRADIARSLSELGMFTEDENGSKRSGKSAIDERMEYWVDAPVAVEDALVALFDHGDHGDHTLQRRVIETYIRRLYQPYLVKGSVRMQWQRSAMLASWQFYEEGPLRVAAAAEESEPVKWRGAMAVLSSLNTLSSTVRTALEEWFGVTQETKDSNHTRLGNVLHIALVGRKNQLSAHQDSGDEGQTQERVEKLAKGLKGETLRGLLQAAGVGVVSCIIQRDEGRGPIRHCFHWSQETKSYAEDPLYRHVEAPLSGFLELDNLKELGTMKYSLSRDRQWHLYSVQEKKGKSTVKRTFLRTFVRQTKTLDEDGTFESVIKALQGALEELEVAEGRAEHVHMYLCVLRPQGVRSLASSIVMWLEALVHKIYAALGTRMYRLAVLAWELRMSLGGEGIWRVVVSNATGYTCKVEIYREVRDPLTKQTVYSSPFPGCEGPLHGVPLSKQCKPLEALDSRRLLARKNGTTFCYDFPLVFEAALKQCWKESGMELPKDTTAFCATELVFPTANQSWDATLVETNRPSASNDIGMVAWRLELCTPEYPQGRHLIVVSNDVTHAAGSFGPKEDAFFKCVTDMACREKLPLVYLAANSGARIDVAEEVRRSFQVGWLDDSRPEHGFHYLYLRPDDYSKLGAFVNAHKLEVADGQVRWVIDDIIGQKDGLGVENLSGSGAIASAYSKAYRETFTLTYVSGKTVGIGAYLARLGMRCIQRLDQPIILTGYSALNKLLGREVYSSQMQLGGPKVMATNGVTHLTVSDDLEGVSAILNWLSYVPSVKGGGLPSRPSDDPPDRTVAYVPENSCDPRAAVAGVYNSEGGGGWMGGIFDKGSFTETLEGWARTVVTGRARLGGIPVGIIAVETQTVMQVIPADPGQLDSQERVVPQAGQVWFPDSASKTAQAMIDFNNEGLPLFILANWRGFSGGQRDLFEGVLQAGSTIVEHLRTYQQPVFVYVPRNGELRGGAWVVVDSKINPDQVEMYADSTARAGVLEAEGVAEIKFRREQILDSMKRLDPVLPRLEDPAAMRARQDSLIPVYKQIALRFIDMHDTAFRLAAKGIIRRVVDWECSRSFFYNRLARRLAQESVIQRVLAAAGSECSHRDALELLRQWFLTWSSSSTGDGDGWADDTLVVEWLASNESRIQRELQQLRVQKVSRQMLSDCQNRNDDLEVLPQVIRNLVDKMDPAARQALKEQIKAALL